MPDVLQVSLDLIKFGAQGITVHPRPDERHIRREDVYILKKNISSVEFNIEGYPSQEFIDMCCEVSPDQVTLVPDPPDAITSNAGFVVSKQAGLLSASIAKLKKSRVRVSVFVGNDLTQNDFDFLKNTGCDRVELYTEDYANSFGTSKQQEVVSQYVRTAQMATHSSLGVNAGHDLNLKNLAFFKAHIPGLIEVSIGHALICDALFFGLQQTVQKYLTCLK